MFSTKIKKLKTIAGFLCKNNKLKKLVINLFMCGNIEADEFEFLGKAL